MAQPYHLGAKTSLPGGDAPSEDRSRLPVERSRIRVQTEPGQSCAYNQTRECFLGLQVIAGDFSLASLKDWMAILTPNSGAGIWMVPFRGILATDASSPLDLLYLDAESRVLDAIEFFPTFCVSPGRPPAASVLALPSHSIFSSQTQRGDRLIITSAEEMEWRLKEIANKGVGGEGARSVLGSSNLEQMLIREQPREQARPVLVRKQPGRTIDPVPTAGVQEAPTAIPRETPPAVAQQPALPQSPQQAPAKPWMEGARRPAKPKLGWLGRWLFPDSADPRRSLRQPVTGLVAHFFTGGAPQAHEIRDVSATGLYVVTAERWYPGTVIRMTLSKPDIGQAPSERSITIQATSVRWGNDGVGLEFVLGTEREQTRGPSSNFDPVNGARLASFLDRLNKG